MPISTGVGISPVLWTKTTDSAGITATTTGAETLTIAALTVATGKTVVVNWGDGSNSAYTGAGARTHNYAGAGTWQVSISPASAVTVFNVSDNKVTLNSANIRSMSNLTLFSANGLKAGTFNSSDISHWRTTTFSLYTMPVSFTGTFNTADISSMRPTSFILTGMPAGYTGIINMADVASWNPTSFQIYNQSTFTFSVPPNSLSGWKGVNGFYINNNGLTQALVDQVLKDLWTAFATRTATAGTISIGGTNQAPSGTYQADPTPEDGKEFAYELLNDSGNINPTKKWATVTFTA